MRVSDEAQGKLVDLVVGLATSAVERHAGAAAAEEARQEILARIREHEEQRTFADTDELIGDLPAGDGEPGTV